MSVRPFSYLTVIQTYVNTLKHHLPQELLAYLVEMSSIPTLQNNVIRELGG